MADFIYGGDVGQSSITALEALARSSGVTFNITSEYRPGDPGFHGSMNAIDMASSPGAMTELAAYLYQYSPYLLELIHSGGDGYFVKRGQRGWQYSQQVISDHYNHVHLAATPAGLQAAAMGELVIPAGGKVSAPQRGCLAPATATVITIGVNLAWMLDLLVR